MGRRGRPARIIRSGKPAKCPKCGGSDFLTVVYGYPSNEVIDEINPISISCFSNEASKLTTLEK